MMRSYVSVGVLFVSIAVLPACLKTRAQLRGDVPEETVTAAAPVQDVTPQGHYLLEEIRATITQLEGRLEDVERAQKDLSHSVQDPQPEDLKRLEQRIAQLEVSQRTLSESVKQTEGKVAAPINSEELFKKAKVLYQKGHYEEAVKVLETLKKDSNPKHVENVAHLAGESYFKLKQYKKAIVEFSKFPEKFKTSALMPDALYKIALSFDALGMAEDATGFYQELIQRYPKSIEAKKAKKKK